MKTPYSLAAPLIVIFLLVIILLSSKVYKRSHTPKPSDKGTTDDSQTDSQLSTTTQFLNPKSTHKKESSATTKTNLSQYLEPDKVNLDLYYQKVSTSRSFIKVSFSSKELVVYTTHLFRLENGSSYVIYLIGAGPTVYKSRRVIGCGVNNQYGSSYNVRYVYEDIRLHRWQKNVKEKFHLYQQLVVECYGLEVKKGDKAFLVYHNATSNEAVKIYSHVPVVIPAPRQAPKRGNVSTVVCTKVLSRNAPWLREFLRYQKSLGVDHVHMSVLDTFMKDGGFRDILENDTFFVEAVRNNFVTVQIWKEWYAKKSEWFYYGNILMYLDCIYRYRGSYDFVSLFDSDDFLTIRVPGMSYKEFLMKYCLHKGIGSCSFRWLFYFPSACGLRSEVGEDGNVTASLVPHSPRNVQPLIFKSTHLSVAVVDSSFHDASCTSCLVKGYRAILISSDVAYVAHNRLNAKWADKSVCH